MRRSSLWTKCGRSSHRSCEEIEGFIERFTKKAKPIRQYRGVRLDLGRLPTSARHIRERLTTDRDNPYLQPGKWAIGDAREKLRTIAAKSLYDEVDPKRKFVYFPLHVTDDYKIKRLIPHCVDQSALIEQVSEALPAGYDIVLKEHPMSIGRNSLGMLRRLRRRGNIRLVEPHTSSHELVQQSEAVIVISSTVGLEALMYDKPVLTMGQPFYSGLRGHGGHRLVPDAGREGPRGARVPAGSRSDSPVPACVDAPLLSGRPGPRGPERRERGAGRGLARPRRHRGRSGEPAARPGHELTVPGSLADRAQDAGRLSPLRETGRLSELADLDELSFRDEHEVFDDPVRDVVAWIERKELVRKFEDALTRTGIEPAGTVVELGAGSCWLSGLIAKRPASSA